jgi:hypothetical protein
MGCCNSPGGTGFPAGAAASFLQFLPLGKAANFNSNLANYDG